MKSILESIGQPNDDAKSGYTSPSPQPSPTRRKSSRVECPTELKQLRPLADSEMSADGDEYGSFANLGRSKILIFSILQAKLGNIIIVFQVSTNFDFDFRPRIFNLLRRPR